MIRTCAFLARRGDYSKSLRQLNSKRKFIQQIARTYDLGKVEKILYKAKLLERYIHEEREAERNKEHKVRVNYRSRKERSPSRERSRSPSYRSLRIFLRNNDFSKEIFCSQYYTTREFSKENRNRGKYLGLKQYQSSDKRSKHSKRKRKRSSSHERSKRRKRSRDRKDDKGERKEDRR